MSKSKELCICGIGPGHPDYILPAVHQEVKAADLLVGARRQLETFQTYGKTDLLFTGKLQQLKQDLAQREEEKIVVLVSGDTGFHSLRRFLQQAITDRTIRCIPGISSFQYLYAKLGLGYENAYKASMHGTTTQFVSKLDEYESVFLLTDRQNNWKTIAGMLAESGHSRATMHIGNRLSYPDEQIITATAEEVLQLDFSFSLCAVIIEGVTTKPIQHA